MRQHPCAFGRVAQLIRYAVRRCFGFVRWADIGLKLGWRCDGDNWGRATGDD